MKRYLLSLLFVLFYGFSDAQTLTIDSCRILALQYNKDKQSAALTTKQAEYTKKSTYAMFFPEFSFLAVGGYDSGNESLTLDFNSVAAPMLAQIGAMAAGYGVTLPPMTIPTYDLNFKSGWLFTTGVMLKQPIYMGGKIRAAYDMSKMAVEMARQNERLTDAEVIQKADEAYAKVVKAEELVDVALRYQTLLAELNKNVESAIKHGLRLKNDQMKVQVKMNEVELQLRRAQNGVRLAKMNLCHTIGRSLVSDIEVSREYPEIDDAMILQTSDVSSRPEVELLDYQAKMAAQKVKIAKSTRLPQIALLAMYGYSHGLEINDRTLLNGWGFTGGVSVSIPLYHFGERSNKIKAEELKQQQIELERDNKVEQMLLQLNQTANNLDEARLEVSLAQTSLEQAEMNMTLSKQQYKAGFETLSDYLETQALWQQAYETKIEAHFQLYLASVAYLKAAGHLVE